MPHIIKWKIPNLEVYTRPFVGPSQYQPIKKLLPFIATWVLLCLSLTQATYLIDLQPYINDYYRQRNKIYKTNSRSMEGVISWVHTFSLPLAILALTKYGSTVRNSFLFFLMVLSSGLSFISSFYYTFGYFSAVLGAFAGIQKSVICFYPFLIAREVVDFKKKSWVTGLLYGLVFGLQKLLSWFVMLIVNFHNEGEKFKNSPYYKSYPIDSIKKSIVLLRVIIAFNFLFAIAGFIIFTKAYGFGALDNDKQDGLVQYEEDENYRKLFI